MTTFCHKIYVFGFPLLEAILKVKSPYIDHKTAANQQPDTHTYLLDLLYKGIQGEHTLKILNGK